MIGRMCIEPLCPVMIHGGSVDRCVEHAYARLAAAESLLRRLREKLDSSTDDELREVDAFLAQPTEDQESR